MVIALQVLKCAVCRSVVTELLDAIMEVGGACVCVCIGYEEFVCSYTFQFQVALNA